MLHTPLSWGCTTRQNSKGWFLFYADLDIFSLGIFFYPYIHYEFSKHFVFASFYHQFIHCDFAKFQRLFNFFRYICSALEGGPKKVYNLNKSSIYFEASAASPHHWTEKIHIICWWYLLMLLCLIDSITLATVFLENLSKFWINLQRKPESLKLCCSLSSCTANMHKMYESIKTTALKGAQKDGALGQGKNVCAMILWHQFLATPPQCKHSLLRQI